MSNFFFAFIYSLGSCEYAPKRIFRNSKYFRRYSLFCEARSSSKWAISNFKRVYLETTFFELAAMISPVQLNRFPWNKVESTQNCHHSRVNLDHNLKNFLQFFFYTKLQKKARNWIFFLNGRHFVKKNHKIKLEIHPRITSIVIITPFFFSFQTLRRPGIVAAVTTPFFFTTNFEVSLLFEQPTYRGKQNFFIYFETFVIQ